MTHATSLLSSNIKRITAKCYVLSGRIGNRSTAKSLGNRVLGMKVITTTYYVKAKLSFRNLCRR